MRAYKRDNCKEHFFDAQWEWWSRYDDHYYYEWFDDDDYYGRRQDPDYSTIRVEMPSYIVVSTYRGRKEFVHRQDYINMVDMESFYNDKKKRHLRIAKVLGESIDNRNLLGNYFNN